MKNYAVVTGGSSGLGLELSRELAKRQINVCIIGRDAEKLKKSELQLREAYPDVDILGYRMDIGDEDAVLDFYRYLENNNLRVKYLFNNAGKGVFGPADAISMDHIEEVLQGSVIGMALMTSNALKMMDGNEGNIINIMSTASLKGKINESIYCMAKWGAKGFTEALKETYKGTKIKIYGVYPGGMNTAFWDGIEIPGDINKYLKPQNVAMQIVSTVIDHKGVYVNDMVIEKP